MSTLIRTLPGGRLACVRLVKSTNALVTKAILAVVTIPPYGVVLFPCEGLLSTFYRGKIPLWIFFVFIK